MNKTAYRKNDEICCITKEKWLKDEWGNGDSDFIRALHSVYNVYMRQSIREWTK